MIEQTSKNSQEQTPPEVISVTPKKSLLPVILLGILGLFVVAGAVYAGFKMGKKQTQPNLVAEPTIAPQATEVTPILDETANWKIYQNPTYGYSLKYPNSWIINDSQKPSTISFFPGKTEGLIFGFSVIFDGENNNNLSFEQWYLNSINFFGNKIEAQNDTDRSLIRVGNLEGYKVTNGKNWTSIPFTEVYVQSSNGNIFKLSASFTETEEHKKIFDQILSTFKFSVDQNLVDERANWKTYTNNTSAYSLKYPPTWKLFESNQLLGDGEISDTKWNLSTTNDVPNIRIMVYKSDSNFVKSITPGINQMVIFGKTATKTSSEERTFVVEYRMTNETNTYFIDLEIISHEDSNQYEPLFDQILSTFKFLK